MIGLPPLPQDVVPGFRLLTWMEGGWELLARGRPMIVDRLLTVESVDDGHAVAVDQNGDRHAFEVSRHRQLVVAGHAVAWADPMPQAPYEVLKPLAEALIAQRPYHDGKPLLLLVDAVTGDGASARLFHPGDVGGRPWDYHTEDDDLPGAAHGSLFLVERPIALAPELASGLAPGDLVVVRDYATSADDEAPSILTGHVDVLLRGTDADAVGAWMPRMDAPPNHLRVSNPLGLGLWNDVQSEVSMAAARAEPDEVVVLATATVDGRGQPDVTHHALSHTGIKLYHVDAIDDHLWNSGLEPGLWIGTDVAWHDAGEDGAEWDANWRRATREDLERHGVSDEEIVEWAQEAAAPADLVDRLLRIVDPA